MNAQTLASVLFSIFTTTTKAHPSTNTVTRLIVWVSPLFVVLFVMVAAEPLSLVVVDMVDLDATRIVPDEADVAEARTLASRGSATVVGWRTTMPTHATSS